MKGSPLFPQCGFSSRAIAILDHLGVEFDSVDVLQDQGIRQGIKAFSDWPTIPQLYVKGEFVGGSDIMMEMYESGELAHLLGRAGRRPRPGLRPGFRPIHRHAGPAPASTVPRMLPLPARADRHRFRIWDLGRPGRADRCEIGEASVRPAEATNARHIDRLQAACQSGQWTENRDTCG